MHEPEAVAARESGTELFAYFLGGGNGDATGSSERVRLLPQSVLGSGSGGRLAGTGLVRNTSFCLTTPAVWYSVEPSSGLMRVMIASGFLSVTSVPSSCILPMINLGTPPWERQNGGTRRTNEPLKENAGGAAQRASSVPCRGLAERGARAYLAAQSSELRPVKRGSSPALDRALQLDKRPAALSILRPEEDRGRRHAAFFCRSLRHLLQAGAKCLLSRVGQGVPLGKEPPLPLHEALSPGSLT